LTLALGVPKIKLDVLKMSIELDLVLFLIIALLAFWLAVVSVFYFRLNRHYCRLVSGSKTKDLRAALEKLLDQSDLNRREIREVERQVVILNEKNLTNLQKIGLIRFNPLADTGGNQSFALALLDGQGSGLVVSTLHSRQSTRIYAKPLFKGKPQGFDLSVEEKQALSQALGRKKKG